MLRRIEIKANESDFPKRWVGLFHYPWPLFPAYRKVFKMPCPTRTWVPPSKTVASFWFTEAGWAKFVDYPAFQKAAQKHGVQLRVLELEFAKKHLL